MLVNTDFDEIAKKEQIINTLLSNPIALIGDPKLSGEELTNGKIVKFAVFNPKEVGLSFEEDVLVILPVDSLSAKGKLFAGKELVTFEAFFVPAIANKKNDMIVPSNADILFTSSLSGCSFVGEKNTSTPYVAHINLRNSDDEIDVLETEKEINKIVNDNPEKYFIVQKKDYSSKEDEPITTAFALKESNKWDYFCVSLSGKKHTVISTLTPNSKEALQQEYQARTSLLAYRDELNLRNQNLNIKPSSHINKSLFKSTKSEPLNPNLQYQLNTIALALRGAVKWSVALKIVEQSKMESNKQPSLQSKTPTSKG